MRWRSKTLERIVAIIVNYKTYKLTIECVNSILKNESRSVDIVIVDNASPNDSYKVLKQTYLSNNRVSVLKAFENRGYSAGLNCGLNFVKSQNYDYFLFANNDLIFENNSIIGLVNTLKANPQAGISGGMIVGSDGKVQVSLKERLTFIRHLKNTKPFYYFKFASLKNKDNYKEVLLFDGMVAGCCFMLSRRCLNVIGEFDENIFLYYEEDAISWKLYKNGLCCVINPHVKILHLGSKTISDSPETYFARYRSALYVLNKYANVKKYKLVIIYLLYILNLKLLEKNEPSFKEKGLQLREFFMSL